MSRTSTCLEGGVHLSCMSGYAERFAGQQHPFNRLFINGPAGGYSVKQHFLVAYLEALGSILLAQLFKYRALEGGLKGVALLSTCPHICRLLASVGRAYCLPAYPPTHGRMHAHEITGCPDGVQLSRGGSSKQSSQPGKIAVLLGMFMPGESIRRAIADGVPL
jgi:hypothetical protein